MTADPYLDVRERLAAWLNDDQLSRYYKPYANPGELKEDIRRLLAEVDRLREALERIAARYCLHTKGDVREESACLAKPADQWCSVCIARPALAAPPAETK